jgi:hypothetical protein
VPDVQEAAGLTVWPKRTFLTPSVRKSFLDE